MSITKKSWLWLWLSLALFFGVMAREAYQMATHDIRQPVDFERAEVLNSPIHAGEDILVRVWRTKVRDDCPVVSHPFVINANGASFGLAGSFSMGGPVGTEYLDVAYSTPLDLPPGEYVLRDRLSYRCPSIDFDIVQPLARFVVQP